MPGVEECEWARDNRLGYFICLYMVAHRRACRRKLLEYTVILLGSSVAGFLLGYLILR